MSAIDEAILRENGSVFKRFFLALMILYWMVDYIEAPQIMLLMFIAPPPDTFESNPIAYNSQSIVTEWDLVGSRDWIPGFIQFIFFVGFMVGTILFGQLADKYGRKSVSWKIYTLLIISSFANVFCQNWQQLVICRIVSGFAVGGLSVVNTILMQELSAESLWVINGSVVSILFTLSMFVFLLFAYYFPSWRTLCIVSSLPGFLGYLFYIILPESPRWLFSQGKLKESEKAIERMAWINGRNGGDYEVLANDMEEDSQASQPVEVEKNSIFDLVRHPVLRYRTVIMGYVWFTTSFVFYCITLGAGAFSPNFYLAYGMSAVSQLPAIPLCWFLMERKWSGRRRTLTGMMFTTGGSMFAMYILPNIDENDHFRLLLSMIAKMGATGCFTLIYIYTAELYPTVVRNVGLGSMSTCARVGSMTAPFVANYTVNSGSEVPFLFYGILCGLAGVFTLILPETRGKRIINTIQDAYEQEN